MELWFVYALFASLLAGVVNIIQKVVAEKQIDSSYLIFVQGVVYMIGFGLVVFLTGQANLFFQPLAIGAGMLIGFLYSTILKLRILSLGYLDASEFFIGYRVFFTILAIFVGIFFFQENISLWQYIGIFIGFLAFFFLYEPRKKARARRELLRGVFFLILGTLIAVVAQSIIKDFSLSSDSLMVYSFWQGLAYCIFVTISDYKKIHNVGEFSVSFLKNRTLFLVSGILTALSGLGTILAYQAGGNLSIVMKMVSYSLFIPIIYSAIVYHEKLTWKKYIAMILTVISIWFLF